MSFATAAKWSFILLLSLTFGIGCGLASYTWLPSESQPLTADSTSSPVVTSTSREYHAANGVVDEFVRWGSSPLAQQFEAQYPPSKITATLQHSFYDKLCKLAIQKGELNAVIEGAALQAIVGANKVEDAKARKLHLPRSESHTLIVYAQRASYFGQDVWCCLCLSAANPTRGTARVVVVSCTPDYGVVSSQTVGTFGR